MPKVAALHTCLLSSSSAWHIPLAHLVDDSKHDSVVMILSRAKPALAPADGAGGARGVKEQSSKQLPKLEEFLSNRDYVGAMSLLEFHRNSGKGSDTVDMWLGYCAFHAGDYKRAMLEYEALTHSQHQDKKKKEKEKPLKDAFINLAIVFFYLGMYHEADKMADKADKSQLRTRLK